MNIEEAGHANVLETPLSRFLSRRFESGHALQVSLTNEMQSKIPHFGAGFLHIKSKNSKQLKTIFSHLKNQGA